MKSNSMKKGLFQDIWRSKQAYLFLLPIFFGIIVFCYYPPLNGIFRSFFDWNDVGTSKFIGLDNYKEVIHDSVLIHSIPTLLKLVIPKLLIGISVPFIIAEMIFAVRSSKMKYFYRVMILLPMVAPGVVNLLIWQYVYDPQQGLMSSLFRAFGIIGEKQVIDWLGDQALVIKSIIFMGFPWIGGTAVLIYMAGLINVSTEVIESSRLDGANIFQRIWHIDIPSLFGQIRFFLITGIIGGLQDYGIQVVLTKGGPGYSTMVPGYHMFNQAFANGRMGYACAIGTVMFLVILIITIFTYRFITVKND